MKTKINLEILDWAYIFDAKEIEDLKTKELVPKMLIRRRLTRAAKIAIFLADKVSFSSGRIVYGSSFGELNATANILNSISDQESISPTHFQNSVYNTAVSYLSMLHGNQSEIMTISSGDDTSQKVLKSAAVKALDGDEILLLVTETLNIEKIEEVNHCIDYLESGVALKVRVTEEKATINYNDISEDIKIPRSLSHMFNIANKAEKNSMNIVEVLL